MGAWIRLSPVAEKRSVVVTGCGSGSGGGTLSAVEGSSSKGPSTMPGVWKRQKPKQANAAPATSSTPIILRKTGFRFRRFCSSCRECRFVDAACLACSIPSALLPLKMVEDAETLQLCDHVTHIVQARLLFCKIDSSIYCAICKTLREYAVCLRVMTSSGPQNSTSWSPTMLPPRTELMPISLGSRFWRTEERSYT